MLDKLTWIIHEGGKRRATESLAGAIEAVSKRFYAPSRGGSMATECITQVTFKFDPKSKPVVATFDQPHASSDGGAILLKGIDTQFGLTKRLAACLDDPRQPGKVRHQTLELLRQRLFGLACGYADCNDAARLADDAIHKLLLQRDPLAGPALASQPTLSRFEHAVGPRAAFHAPAIRVRLDGGFATPRVFTFLETEAVEYVVGMPSNTRLEKRARRLLGKARMRSKATGRTEHLYGETRYAAKTWKRKRRVIIKAEVVRHPGRDPKNNPRFLVTNLPHAPQTVYEEIDCRRGDVENRLKELHHGLEMDRTSCSRFLANQFRVLLSLAAYLLFQELQRRARGTACADAQVTTLRERLIQLAVWVERSVRRIVLHLPATCPWLSTWRQLARAVGATT